MSLLVNVYVRDSQGRMEFHDGPPGSDLAGVERLRTDLYGSPAVIARGARLLPRLDGGDLYLETSEELDELERDCALILADLPRLADSARLDAEYIGQRLANIQAAIDRARQIGGHVVVW